jgi:anti-anti-sigma regulatory factor
MPISLVQVQGEVPVSILKIQGELDASNYQDVIAEAEKVYQAGMQNLLIDMSEINFMSSSGLVALFSIVRIFEGKQPPDLEEGWETIHSIDRSKGTFTQENVKLLNPQPNVSKTLEISGVKEVFEIYSDLDKAIASFE